MVVETLIKQLLEAGVHFGHQTKRWNPKMKRFIFGARSGIYIIDLQQTAQRLKAACKFLKGLTAKGKTVLFVGTKKQAQEVVGLEALRCGMFHVNERWLGGTLTNFDTVRKSVKRLHEKEALVAPESTADLSKKERVTLDKDIAKLRKKLSGVEKMEALPSILVVIDPKKEENAVAEAVRLNIPVIALLDTNCSPDGIDFPIPGNDDALKSIKLILTMLADSALAGAEAYLGVKPAKENKPKEEVKDTKEEKPKKEQPEEKTPPAEGKPDNED